jgi:hypothetical protein
MILTPIWNETFTFHYLFPGLVRLFKIELCCSFNADNISNNYNVLATEYLDIESISEYNRNFMLPKFGPANIDMYTEPHNNRTYVASSFPNEPKSDFNLINLNTISNNKGGDKFRTRSYMSVNGNSPGGGDYVARLMFGIESFRHDNNKEISANTDKRSEVAGNTTTFTLFVMISDVYMIDSRYATKNNKLSFQLCIGPYGYDRRNSSNNLNSNFSKPEEPFKLSSKMPYYLPFDKSKPCLSLEFKSEDLSYYMHAKNFLQKSVEQLVNNK